METGNPPNETSSQNSSTIDNDFDTTIFTIRTIISFISCISCFGIIILYIILSFQVIFKKRKDSERDDESLENNNKIGVGSTLIFCIILSYFFGSLSYIILYFISDRKFIPSGYSFKCNIFGFLHYFFDLLSVGFTSSLSYMFLKSTTEINLSTSKENCRIKISFCITLFSSFILSFIPCLVKNSYGSVQSYCSFVYTEGRDKFAFSWSMLITLIITLNLVFNIYSFWKVYIFYKTKVRSIEDNGKDKKVLQIFVYIFLFFPICLLITRGLKGVNRGYDLFFSEKSQILQCITSIIYCSNGFINSSLCFYFFRGVLRTIFNKKDNNDIQMSEKIMDNSNHDY